MSQTTDPSLALSSTTHTLNGHEKTGLAILAIGVLVLTTAIFGGGSHSSLVFLLGSVTLISGGGIYYVWHAFKKHPAGIRNDGLMFSSITARGAAGWLLALMMTGFYIIYYWWPQYLIHLTRMFDPVSQALRGRKADQWFMYGAIYTIAILVMGIRALIKYRHSNYQKVRTVSVMFFQLIFAFTLPSVLAAFSQPERYLNYFWPLSYKDLWPSNVDTLMTHPGTLSKFLLLWSILLTVVGTPVLTYYYGKRWYCSWVCGCGALANTMGDNWRQLSSKKLSSWKLERFSVYSVLVIIIGVTLLLWINGRTDGAIFGEASKSASKWYGFFIGSIFAGVVGTGFYPIFGTRVWCRFGCPQAALLGIFQRFFSRFRITTNGAQCISCGNCSTYCEMGIDVRWYAQRGQNIVRASCVGCGMCSTVCPRGVLNLENGPTEGRVNDTWSLVEKNKAGFE